MKVVVTGVLAKAFMYIGAEIYGAIRIENMREASIVRSTGMNSNNVLGTWLATWVKLDFSCLLAVGMRAEEGPR